MKMSRHLLTLVASWRGVDTGLFQSDAEWELADAIYSYGIEDLASLELLAAKVAPRKEMAG